MKYMYKNTSLNAEAVKHHYIFSLLFNKGRLHNTDSRMYRWNYWNS